MSAPLQDRLKKKFADNIQFNISLKNKSYLKIGGYAKCFLTLAEPNAIQAAVAYLRANGLEYFILGRGTNTLIKEGSLKPIIIQLARTVKPVIDRQAGEITYSAGTFLMQAIKIALDNRLGGMEFATGIPGSIGGAVKMNAGTHLGEVKDVLKKASVMRRSNVNRLTQTDGNHCNQPNITEPSCITEEDPTSLALAYRSSNLQPDELVLSAQFSLTPLSEVETLTRKKAVLTHLAKRKQTQPLGAASLGSTFKNPPATDGKPQFAANLIEKAGLKGKRCGGVSVSTHHANFIINDGSGTSDDALRLLEMIEATVYKKFAVRLEREITLLGW